jgi:hypothetical protein
MGIYTVQMVLRATTGMPRDNSTNVLHFVQAAGSNQQDLADDLVAAYVSTVIAGGWVAGIDQVMAKVYDDGAAPNQPPMVTSTSAALNTPPVGPREVALCLSLRGKTLATSEAAGSNPRKRGRIYVGPIVQGSFERPSQGIRDSVKALGNAIAAAAGSNTYNWVVGSERGVVVEGFVDDEWDTQRRRGLRPTQRVIFPIAA